MRSRSKVVSKAQSWVGLNEKDGSYKKIIDKYNSWAGKFPRGTKMQYGWAWCACTWSAIAIDLGYTDIMPIEISCVELIKLAKNMGIWQENDAYIPQRGDAILYDWQDTGKGDNTGSPDHIGIIETVSEKSGYMTVIEGNYSNSVKKRTISINGRYIRGFITPKYDEDVATVSDTSTDSSGKKKDVKTIAMEVINGQWGSGSDRKAKLEKAGYSYSEVQAKVNSILNGDAEKNTTAATADTSNTKKTVITSCYAKSCDKSLEGTYKATVNVYCRNDAGNNKKALCLIPKGTKVQNYGYYTTFSGVKWLLIKFTINNTTYTGFTSSTYLKK